MRSAHDTPVTHGVGIGLRRAGFLVGQAGAIYRGESRTPAVACTVASISFRQWFCCRLARLGSTGTFRAFPARQLTRETLLAPVSSMDPTRLRGTLDRIRGESEDMRLFMATLAHELRSPTQDLIGRAEVILIRPRGDSVYEVALQEQLEELNEFGDAVDNFLVLCASESNGESKAVEVFDLAREMELRLQRERQRAEPRGIQLTMTCVGEATLHGDREAVLRAVRNVVANAVDWSTHDSEVLVVVAGSPEGATVAVDDSGPGVPEEMREDVLGPFLQRVARAVIAAALASDSRLPRRWWMRRVVGSSSLPRRRAVPDS